MLKRNKLYRLKECMLPIRTTKNKTISFQQRKGRSDWAKPTLEERIQCKSKLRGMDTKYCAVCLKEDDHCNEDVVNWIQCSPCTMWVHNACSPNLTPSPAMNSLVSIVKLKNS